MILKGHTNFNDFIFHWLNISAMGINVKKNIQRKKKKYRAVELLCEIYISTEQDRETHH